MGNPIKKMNIVYDLIFLIIFFDCLCCKLLDSKFKSFGDDDEIATITTDNEDELQEAVSLLSMYGGTIYIDTPVINIRNAILTIGGILSGGIIGVRQPNGEYPRINFRKAYSLYDSGIVILGDNKFIEYIIIENSLLFGINIFGDNNIFDHVISRYNARSGFLVHGDFNTFNYCYSYRNCDISEEVVESDGFQISGELNNVFNYCFAWDNSNSGFNYVRMLNSSDLSYVHSGSWNNGNVNVFTGKYDYDNGKPLDKNLLTIQKIIESDDNFVSNYYNKQFNINNAKIGIYSVTEWISFVGPKMDGEGFTFGNFNSSQSIDVKRNSFFNVAFDHKSGGFSDNYNHKYNAFITDCASFNNGINYKLPYYRLSKWSNNWSWNSLNKNQLNGEKKKKKPTNTNSAQRQFYTVRDNIIRAVGSNMFPDNINFDKVISSLKE